MALRHRGQPPPAPPASRGAPASGPCPTGPRPGRRAGPGGGRRPRRRGGRRAPAGEGPGVAESRRERGAPAVCLGGPVLPGDQPGAQHTDRRRAVPPEASPPMRPRGARAGPGVAAIRYRSVVPGGGVGMDELDAPRRFRADILGASSGQGGGVRRVDRRDRGGESRADSAVAAAREEEEGDGPAMRPPERRAEHPARRARGWSRERRPSHEGRARVRRDRRVAAGWDGPRRAGKPAGYGRMSSTRTWSAGRAVDVTTSPGRKTVATR